MKKENLLVVVSILEGRAFPSSSSGHVLTAEAKFDGQIMVTDPVPQTESPNFTQELAWPVDRRTLHQHKLQRSSVKLVVHSINPAIGPEGREEIGYVILSLRAAQNQKTYNWFPLLNVRHKGCKLRLGIYVDEDVEEREVIEVQPTDNPTSDLVDTQQLKLVSMNDVTGRYYQLGPSKSSDHMFVASVTVDTAVNLFQLIPTNVVLPSLPYFFYYSLFCSDITTQPFNDLLNPGFGPQPTSFRLKCSAIVLNQFLAAQPPLEVHLFCGDQLLGTSCLSLSTIAQQPLEHQNMPPVSFTEFYQLHPPRSAKLSIPSMGPEEAKARVRVTLAVAEETSAACSSPTVVATKLLAGHPVNVTGPVSNAGTGKASHKDRQNVKNTKQIASSSAALKSPDDSYSATFESQSQGDNGGDRLRNAPANNRANSLENQRKAKQTSRVREIESDEHRTESSSTTQHQVLVPPMSHHFNCSIELRRVANLKFRNPVHISVRYTYLFFGSTEPVVSHPPIEVRRGTEVAIPHASCTFPFASTPSQLEESFSNIPLIVEVWQKDQQRSENNCIGIVEVALSSLLNAPRAKITHAKTGTHGTRQTWMDWLPIKQTNGSDKVIGDMEVMLSLEDLGPIAEPTVIIDNSVKEAVKEVKPVAPVPTPVVDVRDTLEYKKALELQFWIEEQQALYKAQEQQRLKALDEEFHRKLAIEVKKGAEYERLANELRSALTSLEKREKVLKASEEQVERFREDLQHKHAREMEKLRDASVRLKEECDHRLELEKIRHQDMEETVKKMKRQLAEAESKLEQQMRDFETYKNQLHTKPEVRLQSEINLLTLEKVELEKKLDASQREKNRYRQNLDKALSKLAAMQKAETDAAKAQMMKEKRELEHMRLRYLAAEETKVMSSERRELDDLKSEINLLRETTWVGRTKSSDPALSSTAPASASVAAAVAAEPAASNLTAPATGANNDHSSDDEEELEEHILRLMEERDSLLQSSVYKHDDRVVMDLHRQIREAQLRYKSHNASRFILRKEHDEPKTQSF